MATHVIPQSPNFQLWFLKGKFKRGQEKRMETRQDSGCTEQRNSLPPALLPLASTEGPALPYHPPCSPQQLGASRAARATLALQSSSSPTEVSQ